MRQGHGLKTYIRFAAMGLYSRRCWIPILKGSPSHEKAPLDVYLACDRTGRSVVRGSRTQSIAGEHNRLFGRRHACTALLAALFGSRRKEIAGFSSKK